MHANLTTPPVSGTALLLEQDVPMPAIAFVWPSSKHSSYFHVASLEGPARDILTSTRRPVLWEYVGHMLREGRILACSGRTIAADAEALEASLIR